MNWRTMVAAAALALASTAQVAHAQSDPSIDQVYQTAESGNVPGALRMMDQVLRDHPDSSKAHFVEAELLARENRTADARAELATAERLDPGLSKINPRIICAFGSGFGQSGPLAHKGGQDVLAQAMSGVMARKSNDELPYSIYSTALADYSAGMHLVQGILLALLQREKTGKGQQISVSLYDSMLAMQMQEAAMWMQRRRDLNWGAFPLSGVFTTTDGALVLVGAFKANPLQDIYKALELPDLSQDPRYANFAGQMKHKAELQRHFRERFATNTTAYWLGRLEEQDLLCAPVQTMAEALEHGQTQANGMVVAYDKPAQKGSNEKMRLVGTPIHMDDSAFRLRHPPPGLGQHGREVLAELGYDGARIDRLIADKVVS